MKKLLLCLLVAHTVLTLSARQPEAGKPYKRCGTDEYMQLLLARDPGLKARIQQAEARLSRVMDEKFQARKREGVHRINAIVTIPVVVHIILSNPNLVTDADVQWQISKMNIDFAGQNADSVLAGPFEASFGHSNIQFCLAQQDPQGNPTNGIVRVSSSRTFTQDNFNLLKHTANCGDDAWDSDQYLNLWVAESSDGTLGVATFPLTTDPDEQGVVVALEAFGNNPAYTASGFNLGRTAVHETGHFFYARHIWGDGGGCNSDFPVVSGLNGSWVDDTPSQSGSTSGCPSGTQAAGCGSPNPPGRMYQNYMDYTNDACYCMFTNNQVLRMETALEIFRESLTMSDKCSPPITQVNDASINSILSPFAGTSCGSAMSSTICNATFTPHVMLKNFGSANLTSATIYAQIDNQPPVTTNWTGNLAGLATAEVDLTAMNTGAGLHLLTIYVSDPNGAADGRTMNDTMTTSFTVVTPITPPVTESFEPVTFPPADWRVLNNPSNSITWERTTDAAKTGSAATRIRFFDYGTGADDVDYLLSAPIPISGFDSVILSFERAYLPYSTSPNFADTLAVVISTDCGNSFTEVWTRNGTTLASAEGTTTSAFVPTASQWAHTRLDLKPFVGSATEVLVGFRTVNRFGNNLYLDDINISLKNSFPTDAVITAIILPFTHECDRNITPEVTLTNVGSNVLTSGDVILQLDNEIADTIHWTGMLAPGNSINIAATQTIEVATAGDHQFAAWSHQPNGVADDQPENDTLRMKVAIHDPQPAPVQEGFEDGVFPPADWTINASGNNYGWERTADASSGSTAAAWIRNFRFNSNGKHDDLFSPLTEVDAFDSVVVRFDVAHAMVSPSTLPPDTLELLLTKDCGRTFTPVYKKWGAALQTTGNPAPTFPPGDTTGYVPTSAQWRSEYVNLTPHLTPGSSFMLVFRNTSNKGNNLYLDNIDIQTVILPTRLKEQGYMITPNPFGSTFVIRHIAPPTTLQAVVVTNAAGQTVYVQRFTGNASNKLEVNLGRYSSGLYHVKLIYSNKVVGQKLMKL